MAKCNALKEEEDNPVLDVLFGTESIEKCFDPIEQFEQKLALFHEHGNKELECIVCFALGNAYLKLGNHTEAKVSKEAGNKKALEYLFTKKP